jgi:hypothetical protein
VFELFDLTFAAISWEPEIRGALAVLIGFVGLCGSVYLLLATNSGARTGLLLALAGLFGWCGIMGIIWTAYGIGWVGEEPSWVALEVNFEDLEAAQTEVVADDPTLSGWEPIPEGTPDYGELQASTLEALVQGSPPAYRRRWQHRHPRDVRDRRQARAGQRRQHRPGPNRIGNTLRHHQPAALRGGPHPADRRHGPARAGRGTAAGGRRRDRTGRLARARRDLGNLRFTPAAFTFFSFVVFGITANVLHRRDKAEAENRARPEPAVV